MHVYELLSCEEYQWQESHGLFDSLEAIKVAIPSYTELVAEGDEIMILALPDHAEEVRTALDGGGYYWWYDLPNHGRLEDYTTPMFYGVHRRPVASLITPTLIEGKS